VAGDRIDSERLKQLVDAHSAALALYARQWCKAPDDAVQEAFIELLRQSPVPHHPAGWLFHTVRRRAMNLARGERRRTEHYRQAGQQRETWFLEDQTAEIDGDPLRPMLEKLPRLEREIVVARVWGELTFEQVAELVGVSLTSAHRRYHRALKRLGHMMNGRQDKS
jgi:RNA polymerase sigma-70 factor (ECF subfamily)